MESGVQAFLRSVDDFAIALGAKGYRRSFMTNGAYPDRLDESLKQYLFASMMGTEPGMANGISLRTYLKWEGEKKDAVQAFFTVVCGNHNRLTVKSMEIIKIDQHGAIVDQRALGPLMASDIPTCNQAIKLLDDPGKNKVKHKIRI